MRRHTITPRANWEQIVNSQGCTFYLTDGRPYWDESAYYQFREWQINDIERATYELDKMCLKAVEHVIRHRLYARFAIPTGFESWIERSWERDEHTIYGRFDLACNGETIKLLEYNADTPTGLIEASVIQWFWMKDVFQSEPQTDQFNLLHERLIEAWQSLKSPETGIVYFSSIDDRYEDYMTTQYLRDTAIQAGLKTEYIEIDTIGWNARRQSFVDKRERPMKTVFKLYPWEWLVREPFGQHLLADTTRWLEAPWKMLLSNKALLVTLWELFPDHPLLLPASFEPLVGSYVRKPILGREGANTEIVLNGQLAQKTSGGYGAPWVYQQYHALPEFGGNFPVIGSWMINGHACGLGIREETSRITTNKSRFVPHIF
jgi:glutathionylspermidine synthase